MSLFSRLFGGGDQDSYRQGIALYEQDAFAAAIDKFRIAAQGSRSSPVCSLASFYLRQALINESRRLIRRGEAAAALPHLLEATTKWTRFPDLQFLLGTAQGLVGEWHAALVAARSAGRVNPDYCEARLLESCALQQLGREQECARSLNALLESGRRVDHWLINELSRSNGYDETTLPEELVEHLVQAAGGRSQTEDVAGAASLCRSGRWDEGLQRFGELVAHNPRYADYRVQYAAALFQVGRNAEALVQVGEALDLNPDYRTAAYLRGLVLADQGNLVAARDLLRDAFATRRPVDTTSHEELLMAYLRGVLELLAGRTSAVAEQLAPWPDLAPSFARAELLLAAAEDVQGDIAASGQRLRQLATLWPGDTDFHYYYACHLLRDGRLDEVGEVLGRWPAGGREKTDGYAQLLAGERALAAGKPLPAGNAALRGNASPWRAAALYQTAREAAANQDWAGCWRHSTRLATAGLATQQSVQLQCTAAEQLDGISVVPADWAPPRVTPDVQLPRLVYSNTRHRNADDPRKQIEVRRMVHPTQLVWSWLSPGFWIDPVRDWIC